MQAKGWLPTRMKNFLWDVGEENLGIIQNLLQDLLSGLRKRARLPVGCLEEGPKVGKGKDLG